MTAVAATNNLEITKDRVKSWAACCDGYRLFLAQFPEGGEFVTVYRALIADKRGNDADWLVGKLFDELDTTTRVKQTAIIAGADAVAIAAQVAAGSEVSTTGDWANAATAGDWANAATTGNWANAATTGYRANAATTGEGANAATTGDGAVAASLGIYAKAKAGTGGAIVLAHRDEYGALLGIKAAMVGQNGIEPDVWYSLSDSGEFIKAED